MQCQGCSTLTTSGVLGTLKHNLGELENTSTILPTYQPSSSMTEDKPPTHVNSHL